MIGAGVNVANNLKAKNFLGTLSIRNGLFFIAIQQLLLGVSLYSIIHYLHPSMVGFGCFLFGVNAISAVLGFFGALKRNMVIESVYLVFYFLSLLLIFLTVLDMAELVHLLPKAHKLNGMPHLTQMKSAAYLRAGHMKPHSFIRLRDMPLDMLDDFLIPQKNIDLLPQANDLGYIDEVDSDVSTDYEVPPTQNLNRRRTKAAARGNVAPVDATRAAAATQAAAVPAAAAVTVPPAPANVGANNVTAKGAAAAPKAEANPPQAPAADGTEKEETESFYDRIPLVPHYGETEGEAEEVAEDELPPETKDLSQEGIFEVIALYKIQKRPLKMAAAGLFTVALLFNIYCYWVAVTFVLNKCTCLDELVSHPEQFTPLID